MSAGEVGGLIVLLLALFAAIDLARPPKSDDPTAAQRRAWYRKRLERRGGHV